MSESHSTFVFDGRDRLCKELHVAQISFANVPLSLAEGDSVAFTIFDLPILHFMHVFVTMGGRNKIIISFETMQWSHANSMKDLWLVAKLKMRT